MNKIEVLNKEIGFYRYNKDDYISLTDIAKFKNPEDPRFVVINWLRNRNTVEFLGIWEKIHNPDFNRVGFDTVRLSAGLHPAERLVKLNKIAIQQMKLLSEDKNLKQLTDAGRIARL